MTKIVKEFVHTQILEINAVAIREAVPRKSENFMNGKPDFISLIQNFICTLKCGKNETRNTQF